MSTFTPPFFRAHVANRKLKTLNSFWFYFFWLPSLLTIARTVLDCVRDKKHGYFSFENARPFVWVRSPTELRLCVLWLLSIFYLFLFWFVAIHHRSYYFVKMIMKSVVLITHFASHHFRRSRYDCDVQNTFLSKHYLNLVCILPIDK